MSAVPPKIAAIELASGKSMVPGSGCWTGISAWATGAPGRASACFGSGFVKVNPRYISGRELIAIERTPLTVVPGSAGETIQVT